MFQAMRLRHLHLSGLTRYSKAADIQDRVVRSFLAHKASPSASPAPDPFILTAEFYPVYTCGRREIATISKDQADYLKDNGAADFHAALRGGQTTFHGPGQLVAYPILDLKRHTISPRSYVCLLEQTVINTCAAVGVKSFRTENPGVWTTPDDKICALGVHLRRNITSHGVGFNVSNEPLPWFGRIVACGLEGKRTTSLESQNSQDLTVQGVGEMFTTHFSRGLGADEITVASETALD